MSSAITADQIKVEYEERLGSDLGALFFAITQDFYELKMKWYRFEILFGSEERVALLNSAVAPFWGALQNILWEDILLHIARLTDSKGSQDRNVTINGLPDLCKNIGKETHIVKLVKNACKATKSIGSTRNTFIGHRDLKRALGICQLPKVSWEKVEEAIAAIYAVLYEIGQLADQHLGDDLINYEPDAVALLCIIQDGVKANARKERR